MTEPNKAKKKRAAPPSPPKAPGDRDYDWFAEYGSEPFMVFTTDSGVTVGLASGKGRLKPGDFRKMSKLDDWKATFYMIEKVASPAALDVSDDFDDDEYSAMMTAWTKWSGTTTSGEDA